MNEIEIDSVIYITCASVILLCYLIGIAMIFILHKRRKAKVQHLLWLNISVYMILLNSVHFFSEVCDFGEFHPDLVSLVLISLQLSFICYMGLGMVLLNIDRLLLILLNMKYPLHVTKKRVVYLILAAWAACLVTFLLVLFNSDLRNPGDSVDYIFYVFDKYIVFSLDAIYTVSTVIIYSIIFYCFTMSEIKTRITQNNATTTSRIKEMYKAFRRSRFYFAFLIVLSYIILIFIPDVIRKLVKKDMKYVIVYPILVRVSWLIDAVIFMCMNLQVRQLIRESRVRYFSGGSTSTGPSISVITSTL